MKWRHVLMSVAEMARRQAEGGGTGTPLAPAAVTALHELADELEHISNMRGRHALALLSDAFDRSIDRVFTRAYRRAAATRSGEVQP